MSLQKFRSSPDAPDFDEAANYDYGSVSDPDYDEAPQLSHGEGVDLDYDEATQTDYDADFADPDAQDASQE